MYQKIYDPISEYEFMEDFTINLQYEMKRRDVTPRELARRCHISESMVSSYLNLKRIPSLPTVVNICLGLDLDLEDIIPMQSFVRK